MNTDLYTKGVLTVIAVALLVIAARPVVQPATAQNDITKVAICDITDGMCAPVNEDQGLFMTPGNGAAPTAVYADNGAMAVYPERDSIWVVEPY